MVTARWSALIWGGQGHFLVRTRSEPLRVVLWNLCWTQKGKCQGRLCCSGHTPLKCGTGQVPNSRVEAEQGSSSCCLARCLQNCYGIALG